MAIEFEDMRSIVRALSTGKKRRRVLFLGNPSIYFSHADLTALCKEEGFPLREVHGEMNASTLGRALGFESIDTLDIIPGTSITLNLADDLPANLRGEFDCIVDGGVLFWCFDPASALKNIYRMLSIEGVVIHITAISGYYGRGFYNIHPMLLESFYLGNSAVLLVSSARAKFPLSGWKKKLYGLFGQGNRVNYFPEPGYFFLSEGRRTSLSFGKSLMTPESSVIPNNAVGVFAFRKTLAHEPVAPLLEGV